MFQKFAIILVSIFLLSFNAIAASDGELVLSENEKPKKIKDCFEKLNKVTFSFNQGLDKAVIKPIAKGFKKLPDPVQRGTSNAVKNLSTLITIPNNVLQGDVKTAVVNAFKMFKHEKITVDMLEDQSSKVWVQAENRMHIQKAILEYLLLD